MSMELPLLGPVVLDSHPQSGLAPASQGVANNRLASEFESLFFSLLIKNMRSSLTENGLFGSEASDTYGGLFDLFMGRHLATSSGLGIAQMLESYSPGSESNVATTNLRSPSGPDPG